MMRFRFPGFWLSALVCALFVPGWGDSIGSAQAPAKTVLALHWGEEDFPANLNIDVAIRKTLTSNPDVPVYYFAEYLESETFPSESATLAFRDYLLHKFEAHHIDAVIASTTATLEFAVAHRAELFPDVPIIFSAGTVPESMRDVPGMTGITTDASFAPTVELALKLHPATKRLFVVGQTPTMKEYDDRLRTALSRFSSRVEIVYNQARTLPELLAAIKTLPPQTVIFFTRFVPEGNVGKIMYSDEVAHRMYEVSPAPIYASTDFYLGSGVVGGVMRNSATTGTRLAEIANRVLAGTRPEDIPIASAPLEPTFDWRQLQRWGISTSVLPVGSDVEFRVPSAWEAHRNVILGSGLIVTVQLLLIGGLLAQRAKRRRAENTIRASEASLRTSYERIRQLAGRLINAQEAARAGLARDLHDDICQQLVYISATINELKHSSGRVKEQQTQHAFIKLEKETNAIFDNIRRLSHELHPSTLQLLGLASTLKAHCKELEARHEVHVNLTTQGDLRQLHPDIAVCLYRIAQEALRNGMVHGRAQNFIVSISRSDDAVKLAVSDDGKGFVLDSARRSGSGLGLLSMEERAHAIGGDMAVVTAPGQGTTIRVTVPIMTAVEPESRADEPPSSAGRVSTRDVPDVVEGYRRVPPRRSATN